MLKWALPVALFILATATITAQKPVIGYTDIGGCSYYADNFNGRHTSSGDIFDNRKYTCAHHTLPFGTLLKVTNLQKNKVTFVRVNDRGPVAKSRILDVTKAAAKELDLIKYGVAKVKIEIVGTKDSTNFGLMKRYEIPQEFTEDDLKPGRYYNVSGDELHVKHAYTLEIKTIDSFTEALAIATVCLNAGVHSVFFKMTEEDGCKLFTFYYGIELYETAPLEKMKKEIERLGYKGKLIRLP
jgi:rare lipoprotein A